MIESIEILPIAVTKRREIFEISSENEAGWQLTKKTKGKQTKKYYRENTVKMGGKNSYKRCMYAKHEYLVYYSR